MVLQYQRQGFGGSAAADYCPRPGDMVELTGAASVQFAAGRSITFRVTKVDDRPTYRGWIWLTGYEIDGQGTAVCKRDVFVQVSGLRPATGHR